MNGLNGSVLGDVKLGVLYASFVGDTLYARTKILDKRESQSKPDRGIIYVETIGYNQRGEDVISLRRKVLVKKQNTNSNES